MQIHFVKMNLLEEKDCLYTCRTLGNCEIRYVTGDGFRKRPVKNE